MKYLLVIVTLCVLQKLVLSIIFGNVNVQCPENQSYGCKDYCPASCFDPLRQPCRKKFCLIKSCECNAGLIRSRPNGPCVRPDQCTCSLTCPDNAFADCCANPVQATCLSPTATPAPISTCIPRCVCRSGFLLLNGRCVLAGSCLSELNAICRTQDPNSYYETRCGGNCNLTCPLRVCPIECVPGCRCNPGFLLINGVCTLASQCPTPTVAPPTTTAVPTTTAAPTTVAPTTTTVPTTIPPTTIRPTTIAPTTVAPTTIAPTTAAPTTVAPTTVAPTTIVPTTAAPTTVAPTTVAPTVAPTTAAPTTVAPTVAPTTAAP